MREIRPLSPRNEGKTTTDEVRVPPDNPGNPYREKPIYEER